MRRSASTLLMALSMPLMFTACATIGPPQPPSLDLPKPPTDLRAVRKGDRVILTWTAPTVTTDRQRYTCLEPDRRYRYESLDRDFTREIEVDDDGLVVTYPGLFRRVL